MTTTDYIAVALIVVVVVNTWFMYDATRRYLHAERHPILRALMAVSVVIWMVGMFLAYIALRVLLDLPQVFPTGTALGLLLLAISAIPGYLWAVMRRYRA